jgi:ActR/RegA family two-component response regulator
MEKFFQHRGWDVETAQTVTYAQWLLSRPFNCIVVDLVLPDGQGEMILEAVTASRMTARIVVVTGVADAERLNAVRERFQPAAILTKPIDPDGVSRVCGLTSGGRIP